MVCKGSKCKSDCDDCVKKNAAKRKKVRDATLLMKAKIMKNMKPTKYDTSPWFDNFASYRNLPAKQIALPPSMRTLTLEDVNKEIDIALLKRDTRKKVKPEKPVPFEAVSVPRPPPQLTSETQTDFELPTPEMSDMGTAMTPYEDIPIGIEEQLTDGADILEIEPTRHGPLRRQSATGRASSATLALQPAEPAPEMNSDVYKDMYYGIGETPREVQHGSGPSSFDPNFIYSLDMSGEPTLRKDINPVFHNALLKQDDARKIGEGTLIVGRPLPPIKQKGLEKEKAPVEPKWGTETSRKAIMEAHPRGAESFNVSIREPLPSIETEPVKPYSFSFM